jgi:hypothetical protein
MLAAAVRELDPQGTAEAWAAWRKEKPPEVIGAKGIHAPEDA